jgi:Cu-processing system permease protein
MQSILIVAGKEFRDGLRNRWVLAITLVFALLAVGIGYFGAAASGTVGFTSVATTIVSLASLAVFLIPLIALLLAYDTVVGEEEQGTLLLLLTYPLGRGQLLAGKFLGHAGIIAVSSVLGFGLAGLFIGLFSEEVVAGELWQAFVYFIFSAVLLGLVFVAFAHLISVTVAEKTRAAGLALIVWFLFVLVFDLALLGLLVATEGRVGADIFPYLLLLNPTDVFRLANLAGFEAAQVHAGLTSIAAPGLFNPALLAAVLLAWVVVPFGVAAWLFRRRGV